MFGADCVNETREREKSGGTAACPVHECRGESVSSSVTDELQTEETNLLLSSAPDDDCLLAPVRYFPHDVVQCVDKLGDGIFGEVLLFLYDCIPTAFV